MTQTQILAILKCMERFQCALHIRESAGGNKRPQKAPCRLEQRRFPLAGRRLTGADFFNAFKTAGPQSRTRCFYRDAPLGNLVKQTQVDQRVDARPFRLYVCAYTLPDTMISLISPVLSYGSISVTRRCVGTSSSEVFCKSASKPKPVRAEISAVC